MLQNDRYIFEITRTVIGEAFDPALGFVPRPDQKRWGGQVGVQPRFENSSWARQFFLALGANHIQGIDGEKQSHFRRLTARLDFQSGDRANLAFTERFEGLSRDLVNHTVNDVIVMGAQPMYVTDCIVCGRLDEDIVGQLVQGMAAACKDQECVLIGGETSVQPGVVVDGLFVLSATVIGVVDRQAAIDGSAISPGDVLLALSSNGLHTNGYTLVRELMERDSALRARDIDGEAFLAGGAIIDEGQPVELASDLAAFRWLRTNLTGSPTILEAPTTIYRWGGRVSVYTGLPSVIGWDWHAKQQHWGYVHAVEARWDDARELFATPDRRRARVLLTRYGVGPFGWYRLAIACLLAIALWTGWLTVP